MKITWENCTVRLGDLVPWAENPRYSTKAQAERILKSFKRFGQVITVAIDPENNVIDGHQRLSALLTIHGEDYEIAARRSNRALADDERRELVAALHLGAFGAWDWDKLSGWDVGALSDWGMDDATLKTWNNDANNLKEMLRAEIENKGFSFDIIDETSTDRSGQGVSSTWGQVNATDNISVVVGEIETRVSKETYWAIYEKVKREHERTGAPIHAIFQGYFEEMAR